uniref:Syntaxin 6/10/61 N-terminal domain-containing protein n=1 Tax=Davidia involucrata TaxID=16924 RepID=A0A5B7AR85_DAVIN
MASSFHQWQSDPLFSAAEVVQDSADRMESIFRLLLHEQSLVKGDHPDPKLLTSIEYHRRDLATTLETAKWQLEDFERAVSLSAMTDKSQTRENVISRHKQFIRAIREQIIHVEKSLEDPSVGDLVRNTEWVHLNEQDRDGLALFLSGGNPIEHIAHHDAEDTNIMRRFLDPTVSSSFNDEVVDHNNSEIENVHMNGFMYVDHNFDLKENKLRKVGSLYSTQMSFGSFEAPSSLQDVACDRHGEHGSWDLEANEAKVKTLIQKNKLRGYYSRMNFFGSLGNLWSTYGSRASRNFTKRWKDGEEQMHPPSYVSHSSQGLLTRTRLASGYSNFQGFCSGLFARVMHLCSRLGECKARYQRSPYRIQVNRHSIQLISAILFTLVVLGILASQIA